MLLLHISTSRHIIIVSTHSFLMNKTKLPGGYTMEIPDMSGLNLSEKEQKILESAIRVFSEKGYSAATTNEIAKSAGVAEGTIFRYYKTKKDILRGILIQTINLVSSKLVLSAVDKIFRESESKDLRTVLKELLYDRIKLANQVFPMARILITEALYHEDVREALFNNVVSKALESFTIFHQSMSERGLMRKDLDPIVMFRSILGNMALFVAQTQLFGEKLSTEDMDRELDKVLDVLLYGVAQNRPD
jgi:AcrR family transcriptional regulator